MVGGEGGHTLTQLLDLKQGIGYKTRMVGGEVGHGLTQLLDLKKGNRL